MWMLLNSTERRLHKLLSTRDSNKNTPQGLAARSTARAHKVLARKLETWELVPRYMKFLPWGCWTLWAMLPCELSS